MYIIVKDGNKKTRDYLGITHLKFNISIFETFLFRSFFLVSDKADSDLDLIFLPFDLIVIYLTQI